MYTYNYRVRNFFLPLQNARSFGRFSLHGVRSEELHSGGSVPLHGIISSVFSRQY